MKKLILYFKDWAYNQSVAPAFPCGMFMSEKVIDSLLLIYFISAVVLFLGV